MIFVDKGARGFARQQPREIDKHPETGGPRSLRSLRAPRLECSGVAAASASFRFGFDGGRMRRDRFIDRRNANFIRLAAPEPTVRLTG
jgi:hypothetical protein